MEFQEAMKNRRSYYNITKSSPVSDEKIIELVEFAAKYTPSAFNSQIQRAYLLLGKSHDKLWSITMEVLRKIVPAEQFPGTEKKINSFAAGYGTVLYYSDDSVTKSLQESYPLYADNFTRWAEQESGMLQIAVWNMLEAEGLGASLQHYNPLIDSETAAAFGVPKDWRLIGQMPFGMPTAEPPEKEFADIHTRVMVSR